MNGHSKVSINGNGNVSVEQTSDSPLSNGNARLADSGTDTILSSAFKRFIANACASDNCDSSRSSSINDSCSQHNCYANPNSRSVNSSTNHPSPNVCTALISDAFKSSSLDHQVQQSMNAYCSSLSNTSQAPSSSRQRQYKYSVY